MLLRINLFIACLSARCYYKIYFLVVDVELRGVSPCLLLKINIYRDCLFIKACLCTCSCSGQISTPFRNLCYSSYYYCCRHRHGGTLRRIFIIFFPSMRVLLQMWTRLALILVSFLLMVIVHDLVMGSKTIKEMPDHAHATQGGSL